MKIKKILLAAAGGVGILVFAAVVAVAPRNSSPALAQDWGNGGGSYLGGVQSTVTVSGDQTSVTVAGQAYGPSENVEFCNPQPLSSGYYYIDTSGQQNSFQLTQTRQGGTGCPNNNSAYLYTFAFTDNTQIASLSPGPHTLYVCVTGSESPICDSDPFTLLAPTVTLAASPTTITLGSSTTLTWNSTNAPSCTASGAWSGSESTNGSTMETPASAGTAVYNIACASADGTATATTSASVIVTAPASATGMINVASENAATSQPVNASWFAYANVSGTDVCAYDNESCSGTSRSYRNIPIDGTLGDIVGVASATALDANYALRDIEELPPIAVASTKGVSLDSLFALSRSLLVGVARAETVCDEIVTSGTCPTDNILSTSGGNGSLTLTSSTSTANFTILWDPVATMDIIAPPPPVSFSSPSQPGDINTATIANDGAPGSVLSWTANTTSTWLLIDGTPGQASGLVNQGSSSTVTFEFSGDSTGLTPGTTSYAEVDFSGTSLPSGRFSNSVINYITVAFTVGSSSSTNPCPNCVTSSSAPTISITPASSIITLGDSQQLTVSSTNATTCTETGDWSGSTCSGTVTITPDATGTLTYNASAINVNGSAQASTTITVTVNCTGPECTNPIIPTSTPPGTPSCALTATPSSITPGASSNLAYNCENVSSCLMTPYVNGQAGTSLGISASNGSAVGTYSVRPAATTLYTISCDGGAANAVTTVTVNSPGLNETNP